MKTHLQTSDLPAVMEMLAENSLTRVARLFEVSHANVMRGFLVKHGIDPNKYKFKPGPKKGTGSKLHFSHEPKQLRDWPLHLSFFEFNLAVRD